MVIINIVINLEFKNARLNINRDLVTAQHSSQTIFSGWFCRRILAFSITRLSQFPDNLHLQCVFLRHDIGFYFD